MTDNKQKSCYSKNGFTLVELIVVIVILAILATIAFLSFSSQSSSARDSTRLADMSNISKGLNTFSATVGKTPLPDQTRINIYSGSLQVGYQGYAGDNVLKMIKMSSQGGKDPIDGSYYVYSTNYTQSKTQILGFLENQGSTTMGFNPFNNKDEANAITISNRYPVEKGDSLGVILYQTGANTFTPIQDIATYSAGLDTSSGTITSNSSIIAVIDNSVTPSNSLLTQVSTTFTSTGGYNPNSGTGTGGNGNSNITVSNCSAGGQILTGSTTYGSCDTPDIIACTGAGSGYVVAACNAGATAASEYSLCTNTASCTVARIGNYYDFGGTGSYVSGNSSYSWDWVSAGGTDGGSANFWGVTESSKTTATYGNSSTANQIKMQGPCASGYHVPTNKEWVELVYKITGNTGPWGSADVSLLRSALKLPYGGCKVGVDCNTNLQGTNSYYWTSSPNGNYGYSVTITNYPVLNPNSNTFNRGNGFSVRCVKNY